MLLKETLGLRCERGKVKVRIQAPRSTGKCNSSAAGVEAAMDESRSARGMWKTETGGQALHRALEWKGPPMSARPSAYQSPPSHFWLHPSRSFFISPRAG
jgi:hypothetical protein